MNTLLKLSSVKPEKNCNCISPFHLEDVTGINPNTGRPYSTEDLNILKTSLYRISNAKGCELGVCCDPKDPFTSMDKSFIEKFKKIYPKILPVYNGKELVSIKLSVTKDVKESGWIDPTPYFICKITKAQINETSDPTIKNAENLVDDCFVNNCNEAETITFKKLLSSSKVDMKYTYFDDARVTQAILEGNISYVKEYIRKYQDVNMPLTNDDMSNRMVHIAAGSKNKKILELLIALKANLNIVNKLLQTPIMFAIKSKNIDNIELLLSQGVDLDLADTDGNTSIFYAVETGDIRIINLLYNNNSTVLIVNKKGNNLIHHCILKCPSAGKGSNDEPIDKARIIRFFLERGVSSEQKNKEGKTPLELTSNQINIEETKQNIKQTNNELSQMVNEKFFNTKTIEKFQATEVDANTLTSNPEYLSLLQIQTLLFNNVIKNNPDKYNKYINVKDLPKGAPIEVLDTVCVGGIDITGNESSDECIKKGGEIVKVKNKTTKIKLELTPSNDIDIDKVNEEELYYKKEQPKYPAFKIPDSIQKYNQGITYNIGESSTNDLELMAKNIEKTVGVMDANDNSNNNLTFEPSPIPTLETTSEHPPEIDTDTLTKSTNDAIRNSEKISTNTTQTNTTTPASKSDNSESFLQQHWVSILIIIISVLIAMGVAYYLFIHRK